VFPYFRIMCGTYIPCVLNFIRECPYGVNGVYEVNCQSVEHAQTRARSRGQNCNGDSKWILRLIKDHAFVMLANARCPVSVYSFSV